MIVQFSAVCPAQAQLQSRLAAQAAGLRQAAGGGVVPRGQEQGAQLAPECSMRALCLALVFDHAAWQPEAPATRRPTPLEPV